MTSFIAIGDDKRRSQPTFLEPKKWQWTQSYDKKKTRSLEEGYAARMLKGGYLEPRKGLLDEEPNDEDRWSRTRLEIMHSKDGRLYEKLAAGE